MKASSLFCALFVFVGSLPFLTFAADFNLEKDLQHALEQSRSMAVSPQTQARKEGSAISLQRASVNLESGSAKMSEVERLRSMLEDTLVSHLLLQERFRLRSEKVKNMGDRSCWAASGHGRKVHNGTR